MPLHALPFIVLVGLFFGSTLIASRFSVGQFEPTAYISLRLLIASLAHIVTYALVSRQRWPRERLLWRRSAFLGIFGTAIPMTAIVHSLRYQSSGVTSLLLTVGPAITVVIAHFLLADERLNRHKIAGVICAFSGAALLALQGESGLADVTRASPVGYALVLGAVTVGSSMTVYARARMKELNAFDVASVRMFIAAAVLAPVTFLTVGYDLSAVTAAGYGALLYAALIGTFSGLLGNFYNIKRFGATPAAMTAFVIPIVATAGGALILDEQITGTIAAGMVLIISGIAILNRRGATFPTRPL